jgi:hypothetical protein
LNLFVYAGYHQPTPARALGAGLDLDRNTAGPSKRDGGGGVSQLRDEGRVPWETRSDELAEDLRSRDVLNNKAKSWLVHKFLFCVFLLLFVVVVVVDVFCTSKSQYLPILSSARTAANVDIFSYAENFFILKSKKNLAFH